MDKTMMYIPNQAAQDYDEIFAYYENLIADDVDHLNFKFLSFGIYGTIKHAMSRYGMRLSDAKRMAYEIQEIEIKWRGK